MLAAKIVGLGVVGVGGLVLVYLSSETSEMPLWRPASEDKNASTLYSEGKYANKYQKYLVGVEDETTTGSTSVKNDNWLNWSYKYRLLTNKSTLKDKFSTVDSGTTGNNSLRAVCKAAYQDKLNSSSSSDGKIKTQINGEEKDKFLESNIWLFCSSGGTKIKTIEEASETGDYTQNTSYGHKYKSELIAIKNNDWFWELKQKDYEKESNKDPQITPTVKKWCETSYKQNPPSEGTTENPSEADVFKWCSIAGSKTSK